MEIYLDFLKIFFNQLYKLKYMNRFCYTCICTLCNFFSSNTMHIFGSCFESQPSLTFYKKLSVCALLILLTVSVYCFRLVFVLVIRQGMWNFMVCWFYKKLKEEFQHIKVNRLDMFIYWSSLILILLIKFDFDCLELF